MDNIIFSSLEKVSEMLKEKLTYFFNKIKDKIELYPKSSSFELSKDELKLIEDAKKLVRQHFGVSVANTLKNMSKEERIEIVASFTREFLDISGLYDVNIVFTNNMTCNSGFNSVWGEYKSDTKELVLNTDFFDFDDDRMLKNLVDTAIHESRHAMQWQAVEGNNKYNVSRKTKKRWEQNLYYEYIHAENDIEGYYYQPVEMDARNFTTLIIGNF